jgi:hypothetical protein
MQRGTRSGLWALGLALACALALGTGCRESRADEVAQAKPMGENLVVLELFTSQGCSSCPSADDVLMDMGKDPAYQGKILPLSFHVDYWNYLGWKDPFSSPLWSQRQQAYGKAFQSNRIYTPQLVIAGREHVVGSRRGKVLSATQAASQRQATGDASAQVTWDEGALKVDVSASLRPGASDAEVWVVVFERGLGNKVTRGENTGRTLHHHNVVRKMRKAFALKAGASDKKTVTLQAEPGWKQDKVGVAVLVQDPSNMAILAAAQAP